MQAKIEPGNINHVQISPTLQATKSNYLRLHKGATPRYLDYFLDPDATILVDCLQSEQGARFLGKRNRNMVVLVEDEISVADDYLWLTLGQIKKLLRHDNVVNMDTRTVTSCLSYSDFSDDLTFSYLNVEDNTLSSFRGEEVTRFEDIISWLTRLKVNYFLDIEQVVL